MQHDSKRKVPNLGLRYSTGRKLDIIVSKAEKAQKQRFDRILFLTTSNQKLPTSIAMGQESCHCSREKAAGNRQTQCGMKPNTGCWWKSEQRDRLHGVCWTEGWQGGERP